MKRKTASISLVAILVFGAQAVSPAAASVQSQTATEEAFAAQLVAFAEENPGDVAGFERLAIQLGGEVDSSTATLRTSEVPALRNGTGIRPGSRTARANFPSDVFTVSIVRGSVGNVAIVTGSFNWRDNFAGQAAPLDFAALRFSSGCGTISGLTASTRNVSGQVTNRATLRSAGVGTNAPIWNVDATTVGFVNQADRGSFTARYDLSTCGGTRVQAAFDYEGNQGGSVVSVSAGFAGLNVSYNNVGLELTKSTPPITLN